MTVNFQTLWDGYPNANRIELFRDLGGGWPALIEDPAFQNTCALRLSVAMRETGNAPPTEMVKKDGNLKDGKGNSLIVRVTTAKAWLESLLGPSTWGTSKQVGADIGDGLIPAWKGILLYRVPNATDASGHVDLWNMNKCRIDCHSHFARSATTVELWRLL